MHGHGPHRNAASSRCPAPGQGSGISSANRRSARRCQNMGVPVTPVGNKAKRLPKHRRLGSASVDRHVPTRCAGPLEQGHDQPPPDPMTTERRVDIEPPHTQGTRRNGVECQTPAARKHARDMGDEQYLARAVEAQRPPPIPRQAVPGSGSPRVAPPRAGWASLPEASHSRPRPAGSSAWPRFNAIQPMSPPRRVPHRPVLQKARPHRHLPVPPRDVQHVGRPGQPRHPAT